MMSQIKCDVEISITVAGEETIEPVPACLQEAFACTSGDRRVEPKKHVTLPRRYSQHVTGLCTGTQPSQGAAEGTEDRERDLTTALQWIKQEMEIMKEQDKALMKQFLSLRSNIVQLRCLYELTGSSTSDLSMDGSCTSLEDGPDSPFLMSSGYLANPDLELTEFRERTTSLLAPKDYKNGAVTRIRWKSNEYL